MHTPIYWNKISGLYNNDRLNCHIISMVRVETKRILFYFSNKSNKNTDQNYD